MDALYLKTFLNTKKTEHRKCFFSKYQMENILVFVVVNVCILFTESFYVQQILKQQFYIFIKTND